MEYSGITNRWVWIEHESGPMRVKQTRGRNEVSVSTCEKLAVMKF
jgi:hypothetical protein